MEYVMLDKVPINLVNPNKLNEILRNVSLKLPANVELFAGIRFNNIFLYYEMIETVVLADSHSFKLVLSVPLKSMNRNFVLYKMFAFPLKVMSNRYVLVELKHGYLSIN
jgi:hypothetical protein